MVSLSWVKRLIYQFDMFCSSELLRYRSETQYKTLTGGLLSLAIIAVVVGGFASMVGDTLKKTSISSSLLMQKQSDPPLVTLRSDSDGMFMLGLSIRSYDYTFIADLITGPQYFTLQLNFLQFVGGMLVNRTKVPLQQCTHKHWKMMPELDDIFDSYGVGKWLCVPYGTQLPLRGSLTSYIYSLAGIQILPCNNITSNNQCAAQEEIDSLMKLHQNFYLNFNYINPVINPNEPDFISYYVQGNDYVIFSSTIGSEAWVQFADYTVNTDDSIWPYQHSVTTIGSIVEGKAVNHPYSVSENGSFARLFFAKSENSLSYNREVQKISAVLSYIGGLVGAVTALLFFFKSYTDTSLQVTMGLRLFDFNQKQKDQQYTNKKKFNLFDFFRLMSYRFLKFCGCGWKKNLKMGERLQMCQKQALKQMDIGILLRRIIKLQTCMSRLFSPDQLKQIRDAQSITFSSAKHMRLLLLGEAEKLDSDEEPQQKGKTEKKVKISSQIDGHPKSEEEPQGEGDKIDSGISIFKNKFKSIIPAEFESEIEPYESRIQQLKTFYRRPLSFRTRNKIANEAQIKAIKTQNKA